MSSESRDLSKMPDAEISRQLDALRTEQTRRLNQQMEQVLGEIDELLKKYPQLNEGAILRVALGKRQASEARERHVHKQSTGDINIHANYNIGRDAHPQESEESEDIEIDK